MWKKILYNVFLNIGILVLAYSAVASYNGHQYGIMAGSCILIAFLIYLKVKLAKAVRSSIKTGKS